MNDTAPARPIAPPATTSASECRSNITRDAPMTTASARAIATAHGSAQRLRFQNGSHYCRDQSAIDSGGRSGMTAWIAEVSLRRQTIARKEAQLQKQDQTKRAGDCDQPGKRPTAPSRQSKRQGHRNGKRQHDCLVTEIRYANRSDEARPQVGHQTPTRYRFPRRAKRETCEGKRKRAK